MYFVDRNKISDTLNYLEELLSFFEAQTSWDSPVEMKALERTGQMIIESILDTGNAMIDGFIMRDPGSYEDIIDILMDEKVISESDGQGLKKIILYRKKLVQEYLEIDHNELAASIKSQLGSLKAYSPSVRSYLENNLGPVTAFKP